MNESEPLKITLPDVLHRMILMRIVKTPAGRQVPCEIYVDVRIVGEDVSDTEKIFEDIVSVARQGIAGTIAGADVVASEDRASSHQGESEIVSHLAENAVGAAVALSKAKGVSFVGIDQEERGHQTLIVLGSYPSAVAQEINQLVVERLAAHGCRIEQIGK